MKKQTSSSLAKILCLAALSTAFAAASASAAVVWDLNPTNTNAAAGSSSQTFTVSGAQITARGYDNNAGVGTAHELFFKSEGPIGGAGEHGLGLKNTVDHELNLTAAGAVANFIQLDLTSILNQGYTNGKIEVGSIQAGEAFQLFGSNTQGSLGVSLGSAYGTTFDEQFVSVPNFGLYKYVSVASAANDVLPVAFEAQVTPVPEMSALFPIIGLATAVGSTHVLRRRKQAQLAVK